jgi:hypothetical protein
VVALRICFHWFPLMIRMLPGSRISTGPCMVFASSSASALVRSCISVGVGSIAREYASRALVTGRTEGLKLPPETYDARQRK